MNVNTKLCAYTYTKYNNINYYIIGIIRIPILYNHNFTKPISGYDEPLLHLDLFYTVINSSRVYGVEFRIVALFLKGARTKSKTDDGPSVFAILLAPFINNIKSVFFVAVIFSRVENTRRQNNVNFYNR